MSSAEEPRDVQTARHRVDIGMGRSNWFSPLKLIAAYEEGLRRGVASATGVDSSVGSITSKDHP